MSMNYQISKIFGINFSFCYELEYRCYVYYEQLSRHLFKFFFHYKTRISYSVHTNGPKNNLI